MPPPKPGWFNVFPYAAAVTRTIDIDHTTPYLSPERGGPPGQTRIGNLGPHTRHHHRIKTHGGWQVRQPEPDTWLWRSPHKRIYLINATGSHPLGHSPYAQTIWRSSADPVVEGKPKLVLLRPTEWSPTGRARCPQDP